MLATNATIAASIPKVRVLNLSRSLRNTKPLEELRRKDIFAFDSRHDAIVARGRIAQSVLTDDRGGARQQKLPVELSTSPSTQSRAFVIGHPFVIGDPFVIRCAHVSNIHPLLDLQKLDLQADALKARRTGMPEREARATCDVELAAHEEARSSIQLRADELGKKARALDGEVSTVAAKAKESEVRLYSGSVTASKELESLTEEIGLLKARQSELEDGELEILEAIEEVETELSQNATERGEIEVRATELDAAIAGAEAEIDAELADLEKARSQPASGLPGPVLEAYDRLRGNARLTGRAAAELNKRTCMGCRVELPVMDVSRVREEPWDALVTCVHCKRILVR
ncbi:MAG: C4-type zinc ribbon domain-containing protein [Myxococcota bacterium]|nr:C4-type zinc ribbon domain-containing protein [Myxococcota bacterium]